VNCVAVQTSINFGTKISSLIMRHAAAAIPVVSTY